MTASRSTRRTLRATQGLALLFAACAAAPSERVASAPRPAAVAARPASGASRPVSEEKLDPAPAGLPPPNPDAAAPPGSTDSAATTDAVIAVPVAPPDPQLIVASIGPSTAPQRAASLRMIDEGRRLLDQGNAGAALDRIEKAVKVDPSNPHGYYWLAQVHYHNGRADQALAFADKAAALFTLQERDWLAQTYTFRGSILERAGRFKEARDSYQRAVRLEPGSVAARAGLARLGEAVPSAP